MADQTTTTYADFLFEMKEAVQEQFPTEHVLLAELSGVGDDSGKYKRFTRDMDTNRNVFFGSNVRIPMWLAEMQGGGSISETGTWNVPIAPDQDSATVTLTRIVQPFSLSVDVIRNSENLEYSAVSALSAATKMARQSLASIENDMLHGSNVAAGEGALLATITDSATSLTLTCAAGTNFDRLYPGRVVDVLTRSSGADPGQGLRRKIASLVRSTGVVTFSTTSQATDGGSGSIVHASTSGIYITGSYGTATAGLGSAAKVTGTFQNIDKAAVIQWQGTDGRAGTTSAAALSDSILDEATYLSRGAGVGAHDFGIAHPKVADLYKQSKTPQVRYASATGTLKSGFSGVMYEGADRPYPIVKDLAAPRQSCKLVLKETLQLYGDNKGPSFLDDDGSMMRRFTRSLPVECDLLDRVQLGVKSCNKLTFINNLSEAGAAQL